MSDIPFKIKLAFLLTNFLFPKIEKKARKKSNAILLEVTDMEDMLHEVLSDYEKFDIPFHYSQNLENISSVCDDYREALKKFLNIHIAKGEYVEYKLNHQDVENFFFADDEDEYYKKY